MIDAIYEQLPNDSFEVVVYSGDNVPAADILKKTKVFEIKYEMANSFLAGSFQY